MVTVVSKVKGVVPLMVGRGVAPLTVASTFCILQWPLPAGRVKVTFVAVPVHMPDSGSKVPVSTTSADVGL